ncbi:SH3 domain-containing protein [Nocardiopsis sp. NPDC006139]|uniref:SH3 domain-containing protein n=1 Tax=Nocardiopsis TaxID=2013 RepID=UPI00159B6868|nr:SH3 domain-containing protein [Nocardiopsis flavescens]
MKATKSRRLARGLATMAATAGAVVIGLSAPAQAAPAPEQAPAAAAVWCTYKVNASGGLNIRSGPGTGYSIVGSLANGAIVNATQSTTNGFRQIGSSRWVSASYLVKQSGNCFT